MAGRNLAANHKWIRMITIRLLFGRIGHTEYQHRDLLSHFGAVRLFAGVVGQHRNVQIFLRNVETGTAEAVISATVANGLLRQYAG